MGCSLLQIILYSVTGLLVLMAFILPLCLRPSLDENFYDGHVSCKDSEFSEAAQKEIVEKLNKMRSKLARGEMENKRNKKLNPYPSATRMYKLTWNCSMAVEAQKMAGKCDGNRQSTSQISTSGFYIETNGLPSHKATDSELAQGYVNCSSALQVPGFNSIAKNDTRDGTERIAADMMTDTHTQVACEMKSCNSQVHDNKTIGAGYSLFCWFYDPPTKNQTFQENFYVEGSNLADCEEPDFPNKLTGLCEKSAYSRLNLIHILFILVLARVLCK